jgi:hypothetical protein
MKKTSQRIGYVSAVLLAACHVGYDSFQQFTYLNQQDKEAFEKNRVAIEKRTVSKADVDAVAVVFEGEPISFEYERVGLIEALGGTQSSEENLLVEIKTLAAQRNCNAVIALRKTYTGRSSYDLLSRESTEVKYQAGTLNGIAVRIVRKKQSQ